MSALLNLAMYGVGAFYVLFAISVIRRALRTSCRNCMYYQDCVDEQLAYVASGRKILPRPIVCSRDAGRS